MLCSASIDDRAGDDTVYLKRFCPSIDQRVRASPAAVFGIIWQQKTKPDRVGWHRIRIERRRRRNRGRGRGTTSQSVLQEDHDRSGRPPLLPPCPSAFGRRDRLLAYPNTDTLVRAGGSSAAPAPVGCIQESSLEKSFHSSPPFLPLLPSV